MPRDYFKSPEGEAEYKAINWPYPEEMYDYQYEAFKKLTKNTKKDEYKIYISNMLRHVLSNGEEYILYSVTETRMDPLGNEKTFFRSNMGKYGRPIPHYEIKVDPEEGYAKSKYISHIERIQDCYSIPFTKEKAEELHKQCDGNTSYSIRKEDFKAGLTISVDSYDSWLNGKAEHLLRFGHIASSFEEQVLADEKIGKYQSTPSPGAVAYR